MTDANPALVHVSLTPFGTDGPRAHWQARDLVMAAAGGILSVNGFPDQPAGMCGRQMDNIGGIWTGGPTGETPSRRERETPSPAPMGSGIWGTQHTDRFPATLRDADGTELELTYRASPYLGEHNFQVYAQLLGLDESEIGEGSADGLFT